MDNLYSLDEFIKTTMELRKCQEWLRRAKAVKHEELPFSINELDDERWTKYKAHEIERSERIQTAAAAVRELINKLENMENYFSMFLPYGVWILHWYRHPETGEERQFAIGIAYDHQRFFKKYAVRILIVNSDEDLRRQPPLKWEHRQYRLVPEYESAKRSLWGV